MLTGNDPRLIPMVMEWYNDGMIDNNGDILDFQGVLDDFGLSTVLKPDSKAVEYALRGLNSGGNPIVIGCSVNTSDMGTPLNTPPRDNNGVIGTPPNGPRTRPQRPTVIQRQPSLSSVPEVLNAPQTIDASSTPTGTQDEFDVMDRSTLQGLAKDGKLSKYGVNGRSSSDDIRDALRLQKIDNGSPSPQSSSSSSPAQTPPAPQTPEDVLNSFTRPTDPPRGHLRPRRQAQVTNLMPWTAEHFRVWLRMVNSASMESRETQVAMLSGTL